MVSTNKRVRKTADAIPAEEQPTVVLRSLRAPFEARGNVVTVNGRILLQHAGGVTLLYNTVRSGLNFAQQEVFDDILFELRTSERRVIRVENIQDFTDGKAHLMRLLTSEKSDAAEELRRMGMTLTSEEETALNFLSALRDRVIAFFSSFKPSYSMQGVRRQGEQPLRVNGNVASNGDYSLSLTRSKMVWERAYKVWGLGQADSGKGAVTVDFYRKKIEIREQSIRIGCQSISRWQAEQLAAEQGWI